MVFSCFEPERLRPIFEKRRLVNSAGGLLSAEDDTSISGPNVRAGRTQAPAYAEP